MCLSLVPCKVHSLHFLLAANVTKKKDTILFIDPGFPVQKQQLVVMGQKFETFDVYDYRGEKLKEKLESYLKKEIYQPSFIQIPIIPAGFARKKKN